MNGKGFFETFKGKIKNYHHTFHGTKLKHAESILHSGLKVPGTKDANGNIIKIPDNHI